MDRPKLFTCVLCGEQATGCVYPVGTVFIVCDRICDVMPWLFKSIEDAETSEHVAFIEWIKE